MAGPEAAPEPAGRLPARSGEVVLVHLGAFSGATVSLRRAMERRVAVLDVELIDLARRPSLLPARARALLEARRSGGAPWAKTAAWSAAMQRAVEGAGLLSEERPVLFLQTIPAFVPDPSVRYAVYTDRVSREGAASDGHFVSRFSPAWLRREESLVRGARRIFTFGPTTADALERDYGVPAERIAVVGAGPNTGPGDPVASGECRRLLFVVTDWKRKGGPELMEAFARVRDEIPALELVMAGTHPSEGLPAGVTGLGRVARDRMDEVFSGADALVIPTHNEPFGMALVEGLVKGLPCIGTTVGNQAWIVGDGGLTVPPGDVAALAAAIRTLVRDYPAFHGRALARGRVLREEFSWDRIASRMLEDLLTA